MGFLHSNILFRDEFSIWALHKFTILYIMYNDSRKILWGLALGAKVETKIIHYDLIVGEIRKEKSLSITI